MSFFVCPVFKMAYNSKVLSYSEPVLNICKTLYSLGVFFYINMTEGLVFTLLNSTNFIFNL